MTNHETAEPIKQEDGLGCAIASVAFVLNKTYKDTLDLFTDGKTRAERIPNFYCPEIVEILKAQGLNYEYKQLKQTPDNYPDKSIVFVEANDKLPFGHFLARHHDAWMDPWINLPNSNVQAGFREDLPGTATYLIYPKE